MVKHLAAPLDDTFAALAHPVRRAMVARLAEGECCVGDLAEPFDMSLPAVSKHLRVLERAGLLEQRREGRVRRCRLVAEPMQAADDWLKNYEAFWNRRLDSLTRYVERDDAKPAQGA